MCTLLLALTLLLADPSPNPPVEVRTDFSDPDWPIAILAYPSLGTTPNALGNPVASDFSFDVAKGKKPAVRVFPADWNGDGSDEIVAIRMQTLKGDVVDLRLRVHEPPVTYDGNAGPPVASSKKKSIGSPLGDGRVVLLGALDALANDKDELFLIREWSDGTHSLELRRLPKKKNRGTKLLASDPEFGMAQVDANVAACGADVDGDGTDELVVLRRPLVGPDRLLVFQAPTEVDGDTGLPIATDEDVTPADGAINLDLSRIDRDGDGTDELAIIRLDSLGVKRLDVLQPPASVGGSLGPVEFTEPNLVVPGDPHNVLSVFGLRGYTAVPAPPPADLSGTYQASFTHQVNGSPETLPPLGNLTAIMSGGNTFSLMLPTFHPLNGTYSPQDARIEFGAALHALDVVSTGATYWLTYGTATVAVVNGKVMISGAYTGHKDPPLGPNQTVTAGTYTFTAN